MIWQDLNLKRYSVQACLSYLESHVRQKGFQPIALTNRDFKFLNADTTDRRTQISMALEIEQIEEDITSQVIQMRKRLKALQV